MTFYIAWHAANGTPLAVSTSAGTGQSSEIIPNVPNQPTSEGNYYFRS